ncbi:MAG: deoxynucleoside kinase [Usitatibacter sp.]
MKHRHIVVEGPIGCGKTSLAKRLAERMNASLILEDPSANPFLGLFYRDMRRYALPTQLFFLFQRVQLLGALKQPDLFEKPTVADFSLGKDPLFARLTLDDAEYQLYTKIYEHVRPQVPVPDLVIYLQASIDTLIHRVRKRGNPIEVGINEEYLRRLSASYTRHFHDYSESPLLIVNSERLNFVDNPQHLDLLIEHISAMRGGREFFNRS